MDDKQEQNRMRSELFSIVNEHFNGENDRVAFVLKEMGRPVSVRTIQSWLIDPVRQSSRRLPEWVLPMLQSYLSKHVKDENRTDRAGKWPYGFMSSLINKSELELAESQSRRLSAIKEKWESANYAELPKMLIDLELRIEQDAENFEMLSDSLREALNRSEDFASFKQNFNDARSMYFKLNHEIRQTRVSLENKENEFSNEYGLDK